VVHLDPLDPLDPLEPAPAGRDEAAGRAVAVGERLLADVGGEEQRPRLWEREAPAVARPRDDADVARAGARPASSSRRPSDTPRQRWVE
jgi:hypothetical protein